jgi:hypothetical protein
MIPTQKALLEKAAKCPVPPVAIEAFWEGDTSGWFVVLTLIFMEKSASGSQNNEYELAVMRGSDGDLRIFNGLVPPWPEAERAREVGQELATQLRIPFYFPSPNHPEEECPRWWEKDQGYPCRLCSIPLLQHDPCPWRGICYHCHLEEERAKRAVELKPSG